MAVPEPPTDPATAAALAARAGDPEAATDLVRHTYVPVRRFLAHLCAPGDLDDLTQETYLRAIGALPRYAGRSSALTWLLAIARRTAADHVRVAVRRPRTAPLDEDREPTTASLGRRGPGFETGVLLGRLLDSLSPGRREAFVATQVVGLSYEEAAQVCGCPVGTIRSRVARARADLVARYTAEDNAEDGAGDGAEDTAGG